MTLLEKPCPARRRLLGRTAALLAFTSSSLSISIANPAGRPVNTPMPSVEVGQIERWPALVSQHVVPRPVDIWLPPGFRKGVPAHVLYMHDGQMLFDGRTTWNGQAWNVHRAITQLMHTGELPPTVVVGVWNHGPHRYAEYFPQKALALVPASVREDYIDREAQGQARADAYLRFLVEELKPLLDERLGIVSTRERTFIAGASMGGLISLYALCEYPQVFGGAAGLSTHWVSVAPSRKPQDLRDQRLSHAFLEYLSQRLPKPGAHRVWADRGDDELDSRYAPGLNRFETLLRERGYTATQGTARTFAGTGHNEADWSRRVGQALAFLAGPPGSPAG